MSKLTKRSVEKADVQQAAITRPSGLVEEVFKHIRSDIVALRLPPDTRIPVDHLVRTLGVSQTPIREALSMLEAVGLVQKRHFVGYCTAPRMDRNAVNEVFEIRMLLEPFAARRAAENMSKDNRKRLTNLASGMALKDASLSDAFPFQDAELHRLIAEGSDNRLVAETLEKLNTHLHIFRLGSDQKVEDEAVREHRQVVKAVAAGNANAAEKAMRLHIEKSYARVKRHMGS